MKKLKYFSVDITESVTTCDTHNYLITAESAEEAITLASDLWEQQASPYAELIGVNVNEVPADEVNMEDFE